MKKYAVILPDGAADTPLPQLDGHTPLEAAQTPHMDEVARRGRVRRCRTVPDGFVPGTDVATLSLLGYDPHQAYSGRAPIEAAARGIDAAPDEMIFRCNFVTVENGRMKDFTADHIDQAEAEVLIADLNLAFADEPCTFHPGVSYRNLLVLGEAADLEVQCTPPHDIPGRPVEEHLPQGPGAPRLRAIVQRARELLRDHDVNRARASAARPPVTDIWLWGQGRPVPLEPFARRFGLSGAVITGVDILRGLAVSLGMDLIEVPGATGYLDTNYAGKGEAAVRALESYDLVVVHVEAPDEAGHQGDAAEKVAALERVDSLVVGPILEALQRRPWWRILVAPDHPTPVLTKSHSAVPPPVCWAGTDVPSDGTPRFCESAAADVPLVEPGHDLMRLFIG